MKKSAFLIVSFLLSQSSFAQNITNTLGTSGVFKIKDGSTDYLSLSQSTGNLSLFKNLDLSGIGNTNGVITKNGLSFIHTTSNNNNTFVGINAGNFTMDINAILNTAVGDFALTALTSGLGNSSFGFCSMQSNTTGYSNCAFGIYALRVCQSGYNNSAFGSGSLLSTTGINNSGFGSASLYSNTTGINNSGFGVEVLYQNSTGRDNSAFGTNSLRSNSNGSQNTAVGHKSLYSNVSGFQNTAVGDSALYKNTGNYNTALGYNAGSNVTSGANLTLIGIDANPSFPTVWNEITLGNIYVNNLRCNVNTITSLSDRRDKKNIEDLSLGLDFITKLKPRQFNWDKRDWYEGKVSDGSKMEKKLTAGFIAQELDSIQSAEDVEWLDLVLKTNSEKWEATPGNLFPIVVKAIQELKTEKDVEIAKLTEENQQLRSEVADLKSIKEQLTEIQGLKEELIQQITLLKSKDGDEQVKFSSAGNQKEE